MAFKLSQLFYLSPSAIEYGYNTGIFEDDEDNVINFGYAQNMSLDFCVLLQFLLVKDTRNIKTVDKLELF